MVRTVDKKFTFWMAGYYDDFMSAKALPDDLNVMGDSWNSLSTHAGNPLNGFAPYNPRYKYAWFVRGLGVGSAAFNGASLVASAVRKTHNPRMSSWLGYDMDRYNSCQYEGTTHIQYPDSKTNSNRQRFDKGTGNIGAAYLGTDAVEGYMMFCNGYNTNSKYYAFTGCNDSSYGRTTNGYWVGGATAGASEDSLNTTSGVPTGVALTTNDWRIDTHLAGVYMGEIILEDDITFNSAVGGSGVVRNSGTAGTYKHMLPIHSLRKGNFLVQEISSNNSYRAATYWFPTLAYDGSLNAKGDGDIFTMRAACLDAGTTTGKIRISIGNWTMTNGLAITSNATTDTVGTSTDYAINFELDIRAHPLATDLTTYTPANIDRQVKTVWKDYEFKLNFTSQNYRVYKDGVAVGVTIGFNPKSDGTDWTPADFYGWTIEAYKCGHKATLLLDRVALIRPLTENLGEPEDVFPVAESIKYRAGVNAGSTFDLTLADDDSQLKMLSFFNQASYSSWSLLCFRDNVDRPFWRGNLASMRYNYSASQRTPTINLSADDYFSNLDHEIPIWELGSGGDADSTSVVAFNRQEAQNNLDAYYFGASALEVANAGLGYNEVLDGNFQSRIDSRMRAGSAHPIQMYLGEDVFGVNDPYTKWDEAITDGYASSAAQYRSLHSRWIKDIGNSVWFRCMFGRIKGTPKITSTISVGSSYTVGDTTLTVSNGGQQLVNGGYIEFVDADGSSDIGVVTSAVPSVTITGAIAAWMYYFDVEKRGGLVSGIGGTPTITHDGNTNITGYYETGAGSSVYACVLIPTTTSYSNNMERTISGCTWSVFNNAFKFVSTGDMIKRGATTYEVFRLAETGNPYNFSVLNPPSSTTPYLKVDGLDLLSWGSQGGTGVLNNGANFGDWNYITEYDGLKEIALGIHTNAVYPANSWSISPSFLDDAVVAWRLTLALGSWRYFGNNASPQVFFNTFLSVGDGTTTGLETTTNIVGSTSVLTLPATNFFQKNHAALTTVNVIDIDNDYKHMYILWSDMRNDGNANAYGGFKKENFGLLKPTGGNYSVGLVYADQNTSSGEARQEFVDLAINQDLDIWEMGSTDPLTGAKWSALATLGSNTESNSKYHDWEEKAGSFIIIDTSKFFNLNTRSNGGRSGQISGGRKEIGDFITENEGFPILLDNYWLRATTTPANIINYAAWAKNYFIFDNQPSSLRESIKRGDRMLQLINDGQASTLYQIPINSSAAIPENLLYPTTIQLVSQAKEKIFHANVYRKLASTTGVAITQTTAGEITLTNTGDDFYYTRDGHWITISGSTTTPSIDGSYRILRSTKTSSPDVIVADIKLNDSTITIGGAGTCTVELDESYAFYNLVDLGVPNPETTTAGEWNGSAYDGVVLNSPYLTLSSLTVSSTAGTNRFTLSSTNWVDYGFRVGMEISISNSNSTATTDNGVATITDLSGSIMTVDKTLATNSASAHWSFHSQNYNEHSAQWLINNAYHGTASEAPTILMKRPYNGLQIIQGGSYCSISIDSSDTESYDDMVVYANASSIYPMRLMMQIQGYTKNKASLTFMESDKFRLTYLDSLTKNWFNQSALFGIPDIGSIPRTGTMNAGQKDAILAGRGGYITAMAGTGSVNTLTSVAHGLAIGDSIEIIDNVEVGGTGTTLGLSSHSAPYTTTYAVTAVPSVDTFTIASTNTEYTPTRKGMWRKTGEVDTFGSVNDCRNTSIANIFSQVQQSSGVGEDGTRAVMSWLMGRDSKPSFRPTYNNGFAFNQNNLIISNLSTESTTQINNIRLFYAGDGSYVDYPTAHLGAKPRWEIIQSPEITSQEEALAVAKQEYEKQRQAPLAISCEINTLTDNKALQQNDGNMLYNARYGYIADPSRSCVGYHNDNTGNTFYDYGEYWTSLRGGNLFTGVQNGLDGIYTELASQVSGYQGSGTPSTTTTTPAAENYFWYGANSISYAVQVVDIPHGMPKTSEGTPSAGTSGGVAYATTKGDGHLRVVIDIAPETETQGLSVGDSENAGNYVFRIFLVDYNFVAQSTHLKATGVFAGVGSAWSATQTYVEVDSNGIYEIPIPSGYWTDATGNERVIVSVNYDYLASLVKLRCGYTGKYPKSRNAHDWLCQSGTGGIAYGYADNASSIFPLGVRRWSSIGAVGGADERWIGYFWKAEWYAPRLHVVDDINFVPATTLKYTDSRLELSNEPMSIKEVSWSVTGNEKEKLSLNLERDVSRAAKNFTSFIIPKVSFGATQRAGMPTNKYADKLRGAFAKNGDTQGSPRKGAFSTKYGDVSPNSSSTDDLLPITNPDRLNTPDGSTSAINSNTVLGSSSLSNNLNNRIKGAMDFKNSSVLGDSFSILGQKKPAAAPRDPHASQSIDSFIIPEGGDGVMTGNGFSLAGRAEGMAGQYSSMKVRIRIPANAESNSIRVFGKAKLSSRTNAESAYIYVSATCVETGHTLNQQVIINTQPEEQNIIFVTGELFGANTAGNTIEVLFEREAGTGNDNATLSGLSVKNVQVANDTRSVSGKKKSSEFSYRL